MESNKNNQFHFIKIILYILVFCALFFGVPSCGSKPDPNDGKCDICGKPIYRYQLGDGAEYCKEHFESAVNWYLDPNRR